MSVVLTTTEVESVTTRSVRDLRERAQTLVAQLDPQVMTADDATRLVREFVEQRGDSADLAIDQLLNTVHMLTNGAAEADDTSWLQLRDALWRNLSSDTSP